MRTRLTTLAIAAVLALAGCAGPTWYHAQKGPQTFEQDKYECMKEGEERAANNGYAGNPLIVADYAKECLRMRGWTTDPDSASR